MSADTFLNSFISKQSTCFIIFLNRCLIEIKIRDLCPGLGNQFPHIAHSLIYISTWKWKIPLKYWFSFSIPKFFYIIPFSMVFKYYKLTCTQDLVCTQVEGNGNTIYAVYIIVILMAAFGSIANVIWQVINKRN